MPETYTLHMREECGGSQAVKLTADGLDDACEQAESLVKDWVRGGDYGDDGASVSASWELEDDEGNEVAGCHLLVDIEPNHVALIRGVVGRHPPEDFCGYDPDGHDWTNEGESGCRENPGVWGVGGTAMVFLTHCRRCGLHRRERSTGSQRNPGEHDTVAYSLPDSWCAECEREQCVCEKE